jgi:hypothetical protein
MPQSISRTVMDASDFLNQRTLPIERIMIGLKRRRCSRVSAQGNALGSGGEKDNRTL